MNRAIIINTTREGYGIDQLYSTMTVGALIEILAHYDSETPVYFGNDRQDYGWYTYGTINEEDIFADDSKFEDWFGTDMLHTLYEVDEDEEEEETPQ